MKITHFIPNKRKNFSRLLCIAALSSCSMLAYAQQQQVNLSGNNQTLKEIFLQIEKQTNLSVDYKSNDLNDNKVIQSVPTTGTVEQILSQLLSDTDCKAVFSNGHILIKKSDVARQQTSKLEGVVRDSSGEVVIGATILVKGTTNGTISDFDGAFVLNNVKKGDIIQVSFVGYKNYEMKWNGKPLDVILIEDTKALEEVVVVGYGTTTKRAMVASVSSVKTEELGNLPVSNVSQGLAGRAAGLIVQGSGGGVNKVPTISIRGGGTPLVVIDGVIRNYDDFYLLSPEDIESMSVLKDASATAVYGSRAADGILQITTKKGKEGKPHVDYSFNYSVSSPANWAKPMDTWTRAEYANIAMRNDGLPDAYSEERIQKMRDGSDPLRNNNTSWRDLVLKKNAPLTKHQLTMTGGSETHNYYMSLGYIDQGSLYKSNNYNMDRTNFRISESSYIKNIGLRVTGILDGFVQLTEHPNSSTAGSPGTIFSHIQNISPLVPGFNKYGLPYNYNNNPVVDLAKDAGYSKSDNKLVNGNLKLEWDLPWVEGLKLRASGNYRYAMNATKNWVKDAAKYNWDSKTPIHSSMPSLKNTTNYGHTYTLQFFANYDKTFGKHIVSALGGYEQTYSYASTYWASREQYQFPIDQIEVGPSETMKNGGGESESGRAGWIGQIKYNYNNKYFAEASIRYDGSDNFPKNRRWGAFYSASVGWSVTDEKFMNKLVEKHILDQLKLRASYGQVGLDNWGSPFGIGRFEYLSSYLLDNKAWVSNGQYVPGFSEGAIPSPDITWFTTDQFDIGMDFSSLQNRLYGSFDYFYYKTKGFLYAPNAIDVGYTDPLGMSLPRVKTDGEHRRGGFDFSLGWRDRINDFSYDISMNFTKFDQLWANNPSEAVSDIMNPYKRTTQQKGYYGNLYHCQGFYQSAEDVYNSVKRLGSYNLTAGDLKYSDFNGDGKIDGADQIRGGKSTFPRGNFGINVKLNYKGFFFSTLFQGATRFDMYLSGTARMEGGQTAELPVIYDYQTDFWTPENRDAKYPRLMSSPGLNGSNNYVSSNFWLINGAYLRMKDFQFGYDFKHSLLKKATWLSKATVAISGQNLWTISEATKYGLDPENASTEHYGYPNERVFAISVNVGF